jgi:hypothetical protein
MGLKELDGRITAEVIPDVKKETPRSVVTPTLRVALSFQNSKSQDLV